MAKVLLYGGFVQVLSASASLKACAHHVVVAAENDIIGKRARSISNYIEFNISLPEEQVTNNLINLCNAGGIDVIIPMEDAYATHLSHNKKKIERDTHSICAVPDWDVFSMVSDKEKLLSFCKYHGIGHPKTAPINDNFDVLVSEIGFPSLIKPNHSEGSKGIVLVHSKGELQANAKEIKKKYGECTLQEYIENDHYYNLMLYRSSTGKFSNHVIIKILRYYPIKGGSSCLAVSMEDRKMVDMCKKLLENLNWVGMADFDILEKGTGDYKIIEINPRVPASLRGAEISGVNFPEIILSDLIKKEMPVYDYTTGKYLRFLGLDIAWFVASKNRFKCQPSWFKFFGKEIYYEDGGMRDLPSMLTYFWSGIKKQLSSEFRKSKAGLS